MAGPIGQNPNLVGGIPQEAVVLGAPIQQPKSQLPMELDVGGMNCSLKSDPKFPGNDCKLIVEYTINGKTIQTPASAPAGKGWDQANLDVLKTLVRTHVAGLISSNVLEKDDKEIENYNAQINYRMGADKKILKTDLNQIKNLPGAPLKSEQVTEVKVNEFATKMLGVLKEKIHDKQGQGVDAKKDNPEYAARRKEFLNIIYGTPKTNGNYVEHRAALETCLNAIKDPKCQLSGKEFVEYLDRHVKGMGGSKIDENGQVFLKDGSLMTKVNDTQKRYLAFIVKQKVNKGDVLAPSTFAKLEESQQLNYAQNGLPPNPNPASPAAKVDANKPPSLPSPVPVGKPQAAVVADEEEVDEDDEEDPLPLPLPPGLAPVKPQAAVVADEEEVVEDDEEDYPQLAPGPPPFKPQAAAVADNQVVLDEPVPQKLHSETEETKTALAKLKGEGFAKLKGDDPVPKEILQNAMGVAFEVLQRDSTAADILGVLDVCEGIAKHTEDLLLDNFENIDLDVQESVQNSVNAFREQIVAFKKDKDSDDIKNLKTTFAQSIVSLQLNLNVLLGNLGQE